MRVVSIRAFGGILLSCAVCAHAGETRPVIQMKGSSAQSGWSLPAVTGAPDGPAAAAPLELTVDAATAMALRNNQSLQVEIINPEIAQTRIAQQRAAFDPSVAANFTHSEQEVRRDTTVSAGLAGTNLMLPGENRTETANDSASFSIEQLFPTGTAVSLGFMPSWADTDSRATSPGKSTPSNSDSFDASVQLSFTQQLLRGRGLKVNLATLRQARLAALSTDYQLRGFVESLVAQVENTYWDYCLAQRQIAILEDSLKLADQQATEIEERIRVGALAESERAAASAEVAQRKSSLIDGHSSLNQLRLALLRLLYPGDDALRAQSLKLTSELAAAQVPDEPVKDAVAFARQMRPEMNQARLLLEQDELALIRTKNGLLPQLDLFVTLAKEGTSTSYGHVLQDVGRELDTDTVQTTVGARFSYALGNRASRAQHRQATFTQEQDQQALANLAQLVEQDVRGAYEELGRARAQVSATEATRKLQETVAQTETEKFRVGSSTALLVAQAQRDLLAAQIGEARAVNGMLKAAVNLYRLQGSLLLRRGVECPGAEPVEAALATVKASRLSMPHRD